MTSSSLFMDTALGVIRRTRTPVPADQTQLTRGSLGQHAGLTGAAGWLLSIFGDKAVVLRRIEEQRGTQ